MTLHVVQSSGGLGSFHTADFVVRKHGKENVVLLFADTLWEHPDLYRFLGQTSEYLDITPTIVCDGRNPFQVYFDQHFLGNSRLAPCTKELKQKPCRRWLEEYCDPADTILYVGLDAAEERRMPGVVKGWAPWRVEFPLMDDPTWDKEWMKAECVKLGIAIPRMYELGFPHNNRAAASGRVRLSGFSCSASSRSGTPWPSTRSSGSARSTARTCRSSPRP
ncbi:hypothetical protein AB0392_50575 [Nonomuraea angiospora]|uniref:hypothetical protein n=1 Tax=Nonomuraea angiospora TaxID=46172 RepID=UPI00344F4922